ncbi:MAG: translation initiation factor IF-3 [Deltaproteobacteria bacterium]|nr:translation initiation factor IF-3 [Candidatus Zymogenaceae bacterium]
MKEKTKDVRINRMIKTDKVRVIAPDGDQLGILLTVDALRKAEDFGLDLVEVAPGADPPVCRIMDYGKFKYQQSKKAHDARKKQNIMHIKEVKVSPKTEDHDVQNKVKHIRRFLENGDKAKVTMIFRGREITYIEIGRKILDKIALGIVDVGTVEQKPTLEGRNMIMIIAPQK